MELEKLLNEFDELIDKPHPTKEERAIYVLLKTVIAQQHTIKELEDKIRIKW